MMQNTLLLSCCLSFLLLLATFQTIDADNKVSDTKKSAIKLNDLKTADFSVLVFTKTNGFRHSSISAGIAMIQTLGTNNNFTVFATEDAAHFTCENLAAYKVIIFCNTTGNDLFNESQKTAIERFIRNGGGFVGIHAATDTYRDRSWPWYNDLVGGIVQTSPNHTASNYNGTMDITGCQHPAVSHLGTSWNKVEEYYYWKINGGYLYYGNKNLLQVRQTGSQNYDEARPIAWYKYFDGGRSFYTALGHNTADYTSDQKFISHIEKGILWAAGKINYDLSLWYPDTDGDGFGSKSCACCLESCSQPAGYVANDDDCNDNNAQINPNTIWHVDSDGDGFGSPVDSKQSCTQPQGYVLINTDCNDNNPSINPNTLWYLDAEGDGCGDENQSLVSCTQPLGYVLIYKCPPAITGELKKWHKISLTFTGPNTGESNANNPFLNYRLNVTFSKGNRSLVVPGYYAADGNAAQSGATSGNKWKVHFVPDETGNWTYSVSFRSGTEIAVNDNSNAGTATSFDGLNGTLNIAETDKTGKDLRGKGFLNYVNAHHLRFQNGEWFVKAGADSPETLLAYQDFDGTSIHEGTVALKSWQPHEADWQTGDPTWGSGKGKGIIGAINYLAAKGNNAFSFLTYNAGGDGKNVWPFIAFNDKLRYDCSKLEQWEIVFEHADKLGMYLHFKTQERENDTESPWALDNGALGRERKLYCRELIARFGHHLALNWNLGEENSQTSQQQKDMAEYLRSNDTYKHHIVLHTWPTDIEAVTTPLLGNNSQVTGASLQTRYNNVHKETLKWIKNSAQAGKKWVVANDEQNTAEIGVAPDATFPGTPANVNPSQDIIRQNVLWGNLMAGGGGVEYYFGYTLPENDLLCQNWRSRDKMWDYNRIALELFKKIPFAEMSNQNVLIGNTTDNNDKYCLAKAGETYLIYLANGGTTNLDLGANTQTYLVKWYNPRSGGAFQDGSITQISGSGNQAIGNPPTDSDKDWLAIVSNNGGLVANESPILENSLMIYPNPSLKNLSVEYTSIGQSNAMKIELFSLNGVKLDEKYLQQDMDKQKANFDTSNLAKGVYLLVISNGKQSFTKKIIIQ